MPVNQISAPLLLGFLARWKSEYSQGYLHNRFLALKRFLKWGMQFGVPPIHDQIGRVRRAQPRTVIATLEERATLLAAAQPWLRCWILLCSDLALRFSEARQIRPSSWNREKREVSYIKKGGDTYILPASDDLEAIFAIAPQEEDRPFVDALRGPGPLKDQTIRRAWHNLKAKVHANPQLNPHDLRRTTAVLAYERTKDIRMVQQLLGHRNLASTCEYLAHRDSAKLRPLIDALSAKPMTEVKQ